PQHPAPPPTTPPFPYTTLFRSYPPTRPRHIQCVDNDPSCDTDSTVGRCGVPLSVCLNVTDPNLPDCTPASLEQVRIRHVQADAQDRKSTRLNSSHVKISYAVFC